MLPVATFGGFPATASRGLSCAWVWCQSHQSRSVGDFAGRSTRIHCWNLENTSVSKSASFCSLEQLLAVFPRLLVEGSPVLGFLCQPHQSRSVGAFAGRSTGIHCWNLENTSVSKNASFCSLEHLLAVFPRLLGFGANRIKVGLLVLSQAVPPESTVGTWKIPALAKVPRFAPWSNFWRFSPDWKSRALLRLGLVPITSKSGCWCFRRPFHPNQLLEPGKYQRQQKCLVLHPGATFGGFYPDWKSRAHLRLGLVPIASKSVCWCFRRPFNPNPLLEPGKYQR